MKSRILYETDKTTVTDSTIIRDGEVYYINQIANMKIKDNSEELRMEEFRHGYRKGTYFWNFVKFGFFAIVLFLLGSWLSFFTWIGIILLLVALYNFYQWINTPEYKRPELTYTLSIRFSNGDSLELYGNKKIIENLQNAITKAMHT